MIIRVEELPGEVDVYDLSVEDINCFIANEICVHNCRKPNLFSLKRPDEHEECKGKGCPACGDTGVIAESAYIRSCFVAGHPDFVILEVDLSQVEVRGMAAFSGDPVLTQAYLERRDVHGFVAQLSTDRGAPLKRQQAKPAIFGKGYGLTAPGLAVQLAPKIPREPGEGYEAWKARVLVIAQQVYEAVSGVLAGTEAHKRAFLAECRRLGATYNMWRGQPAMHRALWDLDSSDPRRRSHAENAAYSTLVQGTCSGLLVEASHARLVDYLVREGLDGLWRPACNVYDSIIGPVHKALLPVAARLTCDVMTSWEIGRLADGRVFPLEADCKAGPNLGLAKKYQPPPTLAEAIAEARRLGLGEALAKHPGMRAQRARALNEQAGLPGGPARP